MVEATEESKVTYEDLAALEKEFDEAELEIIRKQTVILAPLYEKRAATVSQIPNFWPLVFEQAPPEVDQYILPTDSEVLASVQSIDVTRFEIPPYTSSTEGSPRSVSIKFTFKPNEWFEDEVLEKKLWFRRAKDGWTGLVSDPVRIRWKKGKDITDGLTDLAFAAWEAEKKVSAEANGSGSGQARPRALNLPEHDAVEKKMESDSEGSMSLFTWFGFRGNRDVSAEESAEAVKVERQRRAQGEAGGQSSSKGDEEEEEKVDGMEYEREVFWAGEDLAVAISEDLFPGALKYFAQAQEADHLSDIDFVQEEEGGDNDGDDEITDLRELVKRNKPSGVSEDDKPKKRPRRA